MELRTISQNQIPVLITIIDLLLAHPMAGNEDVVSGLHALKAVTIDVWEGIDAVIEKAEIMQVAH